MPALLNTIIAFVIAILFSQFIHKQKWIAYAVAVVVSILGVIFSSFTGSMMVYQGFLGLGFLVVVMYTGVFDRKSKIGKKLYSIRAELSIISFILLLAHLWFYIFGMWDLGLIIGVLAFVIMIPLFITSFIQIRKKMGLENWKKLHKLTYVVYGLTYVHLMIATDQTAHMVIYSLLFGVYTVLRIVKAAKKDKK